jgi:hypothetical protein
MVPRSSEIIKESIALQRAMVNAGRRQAGGSRVRPNEQRLRTEAAGRPKRPKLGRRPLCLTTLPALRSSFHEEPGAMPRGQGADQSMAGRAGGAPASPWLTGTFSEGGGGVCSCPQADSAPSSSSQSAWDILAGGGALLHRSK